MLPLGTPAPDFNLPNVVSETNLSLKELASDKATVIMFICNHCQYVIHILDHLLKIAKEYQAKGIHFVAISSNDVNTYPNDSPEKMKIHAEKYGFPFPYLYDESQKVAKAYKAACTPDFFVFDDQLTCVYRGRFDGSKPSNQTPVTGEDLRNALDNILEGKPISSEQHPSMGCNIKWRNAN